MRKVLFLAGFCACASIASAQVAEFSLSGGVSRFGGASLINDPTAGNITLGDGFRLGIRLTLNTYRFFGHEIGYGYAHSSISVPGQGSVGMPVHAFFYDFLVYGTPEGSKIRPFACGGIGFNSFFPPGTSVYYGNQQTKFGINYGGGLKFRIKGPWGARVDIRQYNTGKPDILQTSVAPSGRLKQTEITAGVSYNF
jgi:opacity protein-like surface antigen